MTYTSLFSSGNEASRLYTYLAIRTMDRLNQQWRSEVREELAALRPTHMVTMNYPNRLSGGRETRRGAALKHLRQWNRNLLQALFGRKFPARNEGDAFLFAAVIEIGPLLMKEHIHALVRVPDALTKTFEDRAASLWLPKEIAPALGKPKMALAADVVIRKIYDAEGAIRYCTKDVRNHADVVWSNEFRAVVP